MNPSSEPPAASRRRLRLRTLVVLAAGAASTAGCYKYVPLPVDSPPPAGESVRVSVTRETALDFSDAIDIVGEAVPRLEGTLEGVENGNFLVRVPVPSGGAEVGLNSGISQLIRVPRTQVLGLERKELDKVASGLVVAGATTGATLLLLQIISTSGTPDGGGGIDPPLSIQIPLGRFTISR